MQINQFTNIDEYIELFPKSTQKLLQQIRKIIRKAAPMAIESIKYAMPTFEYYGNLVHFAAYKNHIGFYPAPSGLRAFQKEIDNYKNSKGAVQFPLNLPLPIDLITKIVVFRVNENETKAKLKKVKKTCTQGHVFYKSSDCLSCPECEKNKIYDNEFMQHLSAPAKRALLNSNINSLTMLSQFTKNQILALHGIGKTSIPKLQAELHKVNLNFKD